MDQETRPHTVKDLIVDVAVSGGGHRATAWALGSIYALLHANEYHTGGFVISSIASVSGGSIANGVIAKEVQDLNSITADEYAARMRPAIENITDEGLIMWAKVTNSYLASLVSVAILAVATSLVAFGALIGAGRSLDWVTWQLAVQLGIATGAVLLIWSKLRGGRLTPGRFTVHLMLSALLGALIGLGLIVGGWSLKLAVGLAIGAVALLWLALTLASRRGKAVERALNKVYFSQNGDPIQLSNMRDRSVHHVFCATELQSGDHIYLSPKLIHGFLVGEATESRFSIAKAVQASAALPFAFPPQETNLMPAKGGVVLEREWAVPGDAPDIPIPRIVLSDGGVYDNMGEQWSVGFARRSQRSALVAASQAQANFLVVANSGKTLTWSGLLPANLLIRELRGLLRDQSIQYDATTTQRRRLLVDRFNTPEATGERLRGVIAHMGTSPYKVCARFRNSPEPERRQRATQMEGELGGDSGRAYWEDLVARNASVGTVLNAIGRETVLDLLEHSVVLTLVTLYVVHDIGSVEVPNRSDLDAVFYTQPWSNSSVGNP